jgi:hypothetical protein
MVEKKKVNQAQKDGAKPGKTSEMVGKLMSLKQKMIQITGKHTLEEHKFEVLLCTYSFIHEIFGYSQISD